MSVGKIKASMLVWRLCVTGFGLILNTTVQGTVISDPVGDALGNADVVSISGLFADGSLHLKATFASGSLNTNNVGFIFGFDTDQNPGTGIQPPAFFPLGAEYTAYFNSATDPNFATVVATVGSVPALIPVVFGSNSLSISIPLSTMGGGNGTMNFGLIVGVPMGTVGFIPYDVVPNSASIGPLGGPTSPVPALNLRRDGTNTIVSWDARATNGVLECSQTLGSTQTWSRVTNAVSVVNQEAIVTDNDADVAKFYRLKF